MIVGLLICLVGFITLCVFIAAEEGSGACITFSVCCAGAFLIAFATFKIIMQVVEVLS